MQLIIHNKPSNIDEYYLGVNPLEKNWQRRIEGIIDKENKRRIEGLS